MSDKNKLIAVALVALVVGYAVNDWMKPDRPILSFLGKALRTALFVAPFVLDEPQPEASYQSLGMYGDMPIRAEGDDGYAVIEHSENW